MDKALLWRVVYTRGANLHSDAFCAGPWHPDKKHVEHCAKRMRDDAQSVGIQSNHEAARAASTWPKS